MSRRHLWALWFGTVALLGRFVAEAQIDPERRRLLQLGYNQPFQGRGPLSGYAFFYYNQPGWVQTNLTLRLAVAPVYVDSELGIRHALSSHTDLAVGLAGGGFADSYSEVRLGKFVREESFNGHGAELGASLYHRFNPDQKLPLNAILRASGHYTVYARDDRTDQAFTLPEDRKDFHVRAGLRLGGREPFIFPSVAMELSAWYEGQFRTDAEPYGFGGDRVVEDNTHLYWTRAMLIYTLPELKHNFSLSVTAGASANADRLSAYRLGGALPLVSEFPLTLPGYYFQEISASRFVLVSGQYSVPLKKESRWGFMVNGSTAFVDYVKGLEQPGDVHSGVGAGIVFRSKSEAWHIVLGYGYGVDAIRSGGRGAHSVGILLQYDLEADRRGKKPFWDPWLNPNKWRGFDRLFGRN